MPSKNELKRRRVFGAHLRDVRLKHLRMTQIEFAKWLTRVAGHPVYQDQISKWENGLQRIPMRNAVFTAIDCELGIWTLGKRKR